MSESDSPRLADVVARLDEQEQEIECLRNTLAGLAHAVGDVWVNGRCTHCEACYLLVTKGRVYCPHCSTCRTR